MQGLWQDFRYGLRILLKRPGFTTVAVMALALGVGATSAVFSIVNAVLLHTLAIEEPERVMMLWENNQARNHPEVEVSYPNYVSWREENHVFEEVAALPSVNFDMTLTGTGEPQQVEATTVSANFFSLLGSRAAVGRTFLPEDEKAGAPTVVVLSNGLWKRRFGSDPKVLGQKLEVEGESATIVGVMPPDFDFPKGVELWAPLTPIPGGWTEQRGFRVLRAMARLKPGVSVEQAQSEMDAIARRLGEEFPKENKGYGVTIIPLVKSIFGNARPALLILLGAVFLVLLIACVNVANLLLARAATRQKEIALRLALGASRSRLVRQLLTESLLLALMGGALGLLLATFGVEYLVALAPQDIPRIGRAGINIQVVGFAFIVSFMTAIIFGLAPALQSSRPELNEALKEGGAKSQGGARAKRLRSFLVVSEVALAVILMVGAGLLVRSFNNLQRIDPGFNAENVFTARVALVQSKYPDEPEQKAFFAQLLERVKTLPGVESAAVVLMRPLSGTVGWDPPFAVEGQTPEEQTANPYSNYEAISPGYFHTMSIPLVRGRDFNDQDRGDAASVAIVNETMARKYWPGQEPIGRRLKFGKANSNAPWLTVVGVVRDVRYREWDGVRPDIYVPFLQDCEYRTDFVVRTKVDPLSLSESFRREVYALDKDQAVASVTTMEELVKAALARPRFNTLLLGIFAALALALSAVGVYGVMAYTVTQQTHEIGVRMALGAQSADVLKMIVGQGLKLIAVGLFIGVAGALLLTRLMSSLLFGVTATDPLTFAGVSALLAAVALLACFIPARRATKVDPMVALRYE
ncbi:MAG TPA: ABC transporter permease [Pyrinomonadaceae bacterium]|nr:ABC transporter permease [Pyrinomonadaceae bacterium]